MGWNTTVVVLNDGLHAIEDDPEFGRKLARAVMACHGRGPQDVSAGNHCNACTVVETHHADGMVAVLVGGNYGQVLGYAGGWTLNLKEPQSVRNALATLASQHGYRIVAKRPKVERQQSSEQSAPPVPASDSEQTER